MFLVFYYAPLTNIFFFFFFNDTATTEIYTLSLHDALPIYQMVVGGDDSGLGVVRDIDEAAGIAFPEGGQADLRRQLLHRSEEHTSELQSRQYLVCRLLLEKKKT